MTFLFCLTVLLMSVYVILSLFCRYELCFGQGIRQFHARTDNIRQVDGTVIQQQVIEAQFSLGIAPVEQYADITSLLLGSSHTTDGVLKPTGTSTTGGGTTTAEGGSEGSGGEGRYRTILPPSGLPVGLGVGKSKGPKYITVRTTCTLFYIIHTISSSFLLLHICQLEFKDGTPCDIESLNRSTSVHISWWALEGVIILTYAYSICVCILYICLCIYIFTFTIPL